MTKELKDAIKIIENIPIDSNCEQEWLAAWTIITPMIGDNEILLTDIKEAIDGSLELPKEDYNQEYLRGLRNGLRLAKALVDGKEPEYE